MNSHHIEIENTLSSFPKRTSSQNPESYIGGGQSNLRYIGLRVPHLQQAMRKGFSFSSGQPIELAKVWDDVWWSSDCYEVMSLALSWFYDPKQRRILKQYWPQLKKWSTKIDNWAHSDTLSGIYARILEDDPERVYSTLVKWNSSRNPWLRRLSIVSLLYYSSQREKLLPYKKILSLVEPQLEFSHYYVQKGVGWTLRETYNVYPKQAFSFMEKHILKLSSHAFSAATEKLTTQQKKHLKNLRKARR
ncbi:MAG: DNA alkylation repair protein [Bdellovibrionaceae bacterium]|nr:DNA alkylation repair protein [Pseudobdellovibrionaceae bacterium]MCB9093217.1 DNA alkylation repair protein [Halobacteriovoraceae bacterium]